jgi:hypothetical protein
MAAAADASDAASRSRRSRRDCIAACQIPAMPSGFHSTITTNSRPYQSSQV